MNYAFIRPLSTSAWGRRHVICVSFHGAVAMDQSQSSVITVQLYPEPLNTHRLCLKSHYQDVIVSQVKSKSRETIIYYIL